MEVDEIEYENAANYRSINSSQVQYISYGEVLGNFHEQNFKVLLISNCPSPKEAMEFIISNETFRRKFLSFGKAFVIVLKCNNFPQFLPSRLAELNCVFEIGERPMIISLELDYYKNYNQIYFKPANEAFQYVNFIDVTQNFNFTSLLNLIIKNEPTEKLLDLKISNFENSELIMCAIQRNDLLCIRFLELFGLELELIIESAAKYCNLDGFQALFGFKFHFDFCEFYNHKILSILNYKNYEK